MLLTLFGRIRKPQFVQPQDVNAPLRFDEFAEDVPNNINENAFWPPQNYLSLSLSNSYDNFENWDQTPLENHSNNNNSYVINQNININNIYEMQQQQQQNVVHRQLPFMNNFFDDYGQQMTPWPSQVLISFAQRQTRNTRITSREDKQKYSTYDTLLMCFAFR
jgi:hypothetical protein